MIFVEFKPKLPVSKDMLEATSEELQRNQAGSILHFVKRGDKLLYMSIGDDINEISGKGRFGDRR